MNAQQLQQEGNAALFQGRFDDAIHCFRQSMLISSQDVSAEIEEDDLDPMDMNTTTQPPEEPVMESIALDLREILMTTSSETISSHNVFDIFDRAFLALPHAPAAVSSVICIYNIGLTHHTQAMLHTYNSSYHFQRAKHFYKLAWKALVSCGKHRHQQQDERQNEQDPTLLPVTLALLNNMGHISCHFWDMADVELALQGILEELPFFLEHQSGNLCHPDVPFFYSYRCYEYVQALTRAPSA